MKKLLFLFLVGVLSVGIFLSAPKSALAYCVYNESDKTITAIQLPITSPSFKAVIKPKENACCNWREGACTTRNDGRYGKTYFAILSGDQDTGAITARALVHRVVDAILSLFTDSGIVSASASTVNKVYDFYEDVLSRKSNLGVVTTYNGGVVWYDGTQEPVGCWVGPCLGNNINYDGTTGTQD